MHSSSNANTLPFNLRVVEAKGLFASHRDIADPFVVVKLKGLKHLFNSEKQSTDIQMNRESPVFNQDFLLHPKENDTILVKVMDKNTPLNRKLGKVLIPVASYFNKSTIDTWFPIEGKSGRAGEIRLLINYGSQAFTGFKAFLASKNTSALPLGSTTTAKTVVAPLPSALKKTEGTTVTKEVKIEKTADRDIHASTRPVLPPSQTVPLATSKPIVAPVVAVPVVVAPVVNAKPIGATSSLLEPVKNLTINKETVVQERIHPVESEIIQPVIHRERQQTEIHRVTQDINESKVLPTVFEDKVLPAEYRAVSGKQRDFLAEEYGANSTITSTVDVDQVQHIRVVKEPIIEETIKRTVLEVIQPVIHKEVIAPSVIKETLPIYEKVIEEPRIVNDTVNMNFGVFPVVPQTMPSTMVKETIVTNTTVEPMMGAKVPLMDAKLNQPYQSL